MGSRESGRCARQQVKGLGSSVLSQMQEGGEFRKVESGQGLHLTHDIINKNARYVQITKHISCHMIKK